jgi:hypothetical protein
MENENKNNFNIKPEIAVEQSQINQEIQTKQFANQSKTETTYDDIFIKLGQKTKNAEVLEIVKKGYEKQLASSIAKNKVADVEDSIYNEYAEQKAEILSEKKAEEKINAKIQELENQAKSYFEKNGQALTEEELNELVVYKIVANPEEFELVKQNPILAKRTMEALTIAKSKSQPLPKGNAMQEKGNITEERFNQIKMKVFTRQANSEERDLFNQNAKFFIK